MKLLILLAIIASATLLITLTNHWQRDDKAAIGKPVTVVVELFTSEGCSSCPPADSILSKLIHEPPIKGAEVVALSEHVDYWNRLGWKDPYSAAQFSRRQEEYAQAFGNSSIYTPQMVVDGDVEFVGNDINKAYAAIKKAAQAPKAAVQVRLTDGGIKEGVVGLRVDVHPASSRRRVDRAWSRRDDRARPSAPAAIH
jgi:hypothetical protein